MLEGIGIKSKMFSPLTPFVSTHYNYRDHRKILVIDGKVGFNGGVNIADEYVNEIVRFGHWKDTAIRIKGPAVKNLTLMFLNMWEILAPDADYSRYLDVPTDPCSLAKGYVIPYADNPFDDDKVGEKVYMSILNRANNYVHIMSPYLILDDELLMALKYAAERGIDVKGVRVSSAKGRWGSCSSRGSINLSLYLVLLPRHLQDYVLQHELTHRIEMNHSPRFWARLDEVCGGKAKVLRKEMRGYNTSFL